MSHTNIKADEPTLVSIVRVPRKKIDLLNIMIPAYAVTLPPELADLLWQIHRDTKNEKS